MQYSIISNYQKNDELRHAFNELAEKTFGLSFEGWYQSGFWKDKYIPYSILLDGKLIANVSVNIINCTVNGKERRYIQLGTVMTDEDYRNMGYSRKLMEKILSDYSDRDGIFLYANDEVLDFYPRFGFRTADEYRFRASIDTDSLPSAVQVPMNDMNDFEAFLKNKKSLSSSSPVRTDTDDLLMFYLSQFMQECVYKLPDSDCFVIAEKEDDNLTIYDIISDRPVDPVKAACCFGKEIKNVDFAFIPENNSGLERYLFKEENTTFFVLGDTLINDLPDIMSFPALIHA